jgi:hypothetical protein
MHNRPASQLNKTGGCARPDIDRRARWTPKVSGLWDASERIGKPGTVDASGQMFTTARAA